MKNTLIIVSAVVLLTSCEQANSESNTTQKEARNMVVGQKELVERGKYLVAVGGCNDCHSPKTMTDRGPVPDKRYLLAGHIAEEKLPTQGGSASKNGWVLFNSNNTAAVGPWGTSFAANLTPDATGIGNWTLENFKKALREGKYKGKDNTRMLLPPMPWPNYATLTDQDIEAVFAYLKSLKPVKNVVPSPLPPAT
ncbi:c-type cytochrome [Adhaeribacter radiodurans]|uniref:C-type cytochrome n=1 Tax=Adhaeribacter radiodurans TaxID=2745197 RepID=A0A7L7L965_9BACT|nr:c-type cytochrome [Adhaeribacter radiodurans]QMU29045.1 c-type cytochrome [Adhaeribacter radiodurans]